MEPFATRLAAALKRKGPLCVGLDPAPTTLQAWNLSDDVRGLEQFAEICLAAAADTVACIKPQVAFFERFGPEGFGVLQRTIRRARRDGLLVISDAKRSDISTTAAAYAAAWFGDEAPFASDALTVTPYLGLDALRPIFHAAAACQSGVFVVVSSSNPEGRTLQEARAGDVSVEEMLYGAIGEQNRRAKQMSIGAVLGATRSFERGPVLAMGGPLLIPGFGAQGATVGDLIERFSGIPNAKVIAASRAWTDAGPNVEALALRATQLQSDLRRGLS